VQTVAKWSVIAPSGFQAVSASGVSIFSAGRPTIARPASPVMGGAFLELWKLFLLQAKDRKPAQPIRPRPLSPFQSKERACDPGWKEISRKAQNF
jgi:hypothetical protein